MDKDANWIEWAGPSADSWTIEKRVDGFGHPRLLGFHNSGKEIEMLVPWGELDPPPKPGEEGLWRLTLCTARQELERKASLEEIVRWLPDDWGVWAQKRHEEALGKILGS